MPRRVSKAREEAYKTAMMWQRRARAKERRLRARNITNVDELSPVLSANNVKEMTTYELRRYTHELAQFADRNYGAIKQLSSGQGINQREYRKITNEINRNVAKVNERKAQHAKTLQDMGSTGRSDEFSVTNRIKSLEGFDFKKMKPTNAPRGTGSVLTPVYVTEEPETLAQLRARLEWSRTAAERTTADVIASQRKSVMGMLQGVIALGGGDVDAVTAVVNSLTDYQLSFAIERLSILDLVGYLYLPQDRYLEGDYSMVDDNPTQYAEEANGIVERLVAVKQL